MNSIVLDKTNPEIAKALEGCVVGQPKTITIQVTPLSDDDSGFVARVDSVSYEDDATEDASEGESEDIMMGKEKPAMERPYRPKPKTM